MTDKKYFYDTIAQDFETVMNKYEMNKRMKLIFSDLLPESLAGTTFLDVGCGIGLFSAQAEKKRAIVTALDVGENLKAEVEKRSKAKYVVGEIEKLPFPDNTFDTVIATEVIEHTVNPQISFAELARVTKPGGTLIVTVPNKFWKASVYVADLLKIRPYHGYENWQSWEDMRNYASQNKIEVSKLFGFNLFPLFYKPFYSLLDKADSWGTNELIGSRMVNIGFVGKKLNA